MSEIKTTADGVFENIANSRLSNLVEIILNGFLYVSILFTLLTFLFTVVIAPLAKSAIEQEIGNVIDNATQSLPQIDLTLDSMTNRKQKEETLRKFIDIYNEYSGKTSTIDTYTVDNIIDNVDTLYSIINSDNNSKIFDNYIQQYNKPNYVIDTHNTGILSYGKNISIIFLVISIILIISIKIACPNCLNITKLFVESILTFVFIGIVQYWFFTNYVFKFVPASPSLLYTSVVDAIKANIKT